MYFLKLVIRMANLERQLYCASFRCAENAPHLCQLHIITNINPSKIGRGKTVPL